MTLLEQKIAGKKLKLWELISMWAVTNELPLTEEETEKRHEKIAAEIDHLVFTDLLREQESKKNDNWEGVDGSHYVYHCADGDHNSFWKTIVESEEWKAWYATNPPFDVDESQECGLFSPQHLKAFLEFVLRAERERVVEVLKEVLENTESMTIPRKMIYAAIAIVKENEV